MNTLSHLSFLDTQDRRDRAAESLQIELASLAIRAAKDNVTAESLLEGAKRLIQATTKTGKEKLLPMLGRYPGYTEMSAVLAQDDALRSYLGHELGIDCQTVAHLSVAEVINQHTSKFQLDVFQADSYDRNMAARMQQSGIRYFYSSPEMVVSIPVSAALAQASISELIGRADALATLHRAKLSDYETVGGHTINFKLVLPAGCHAQAMTEMLQGFVDIALPLAPTRKEKADREFENFDFGELVIAARSGWECDQNVLSLTAFAETEGNPNSEKITFQVSFDEQDNVIDTQMTRAGCGHEYRQPRRSPRP